jgi:hypothetical protein
MYRLVLRPLHNAGEEASLVLVEEEGVTVVDAVGKSPFQMHVMQMHVKGLCFVLCGEGGARCVFKFHST